jgi:triosephosphate isomerase
MPKSTQKVRMRQLIAGNWKMNGFSAESEALAETIANAADELDCDLLVCPPFTQIVPVVAALRGSPVAVGGQDCHAATGGAHTGDIAPEMLADIGCSAVILGHSERRQNHHETDSLVYAKVLGAMRAGLMPIVCVGETEAERDGGHQMQVVGSQIAASLPRDFSGCIAYEPIWAIGTGRTPTEANVEAMHRYIRSALVTRLGQAGGGVRILYGGSVKPDNAAKLLAVPEVGGALVGGASLVARDFLAIARNATPAVSVGA